MALSFLLFASYANRAAVCDALSPVWLSDALLGGALLAAIAWLSPAHWTRRLALAVAAGAVVALFHALSWPQCLQRLEGVSPEVHDLWLSHVREARPVYRHGWQVALTILALPATGAVGWALLSWRNRVDRDLFRRTIAAAIPALAALALMFWQTRTGPAAQMMSVTGAAAIVWLGAPIFVPHQEFPAAAARPRRGGDRRHRCADAAGVQLHPAQAGDPARHRHRARQPLVQLHRLGLRPIAQQPKGRVFTFLDTAPRLITVTHHHAITGPYHRNGEQIADVMKAFRGSAGRRGRSSASIAPIIC